MIFLLLSPKIMEKWVFAFVFQIRTLGHLRFNANHAFYFNA
jgi:hypothetical protein